MKKMSRRKCEMWISNNKVLIGGSKKPHARNPNFETEETKLLISLWGDPKVQKTLITTHKKHPVIVKLAEKMREHGYHRSAEEINTRIKNLKCFYNRIKKEVETGNCVEPTWKHYAAMEAILTRPIFGNRVQQPHLQLLHQQQQQQQQQQHKQHHHHNTEHNQQYKQHHGGDSSREDVTKKSVKSSNSSITGDEEQHQQQQQRRRDNNLRPEDLLSVEEDDEHEMDFDDSSLIPKEEPVDIEDIADDTEQEMEDVNDIFPKLSQYLQLANNNLNNENKSPPSPPTSTSPQTNHSIPMEINEIDIKKSPPSSPQPTKIPSPPASPSPISSRSLSAMPILISKPASLNVSPLSPTTTTTTSTTSSSSSSSSSTTTQVATTSKISVVPANFLMKPQVASLPQVSSSTPSLTPSSSSQLLPSIITSSTASAMNTALQKHHFTKQLNLNLNHQPPAINFGGQQYICAQSVSDTQSVYTSTTNNGMVLLVNTKPPIAGSVTIPPAGTVGDGTIVVNTSSGQNANLSGSSSAATGSVGSIVQQPINTMVNVGSGGGGCSGVTTNSVAAASMVVTSSVSLSPANATSHGSGGGGGGGGGGISGTNNGQHPLIMAKTKAAATAAAAAAAMASSNKNIQTPTATSSFSSAGTTITNGPVYSTRSTTRASSAAARATSFNDTDRNRGILSTAEKQHSYYQHSTMKRNEMRYQKSSGYRLLLQQLVRLQNDTLDVSRQRLVVEKKRFEFEQSMGQKLLNTLQSLLTTNTSAAATSSQENVCTAAAAAATMKESKIEK